MNLVFRFLQILFLVAVTTVFFTAAMTCDKLIPIDSGSIGNIGEPEDIMETARYEVETYAMANSTEVKDLIAELTGASDIQYHVTTFTAVLQPKDLKKLCMSTLVKYIKEIEKLDIKYDCPKLFRGNATLVIPGSYIVMIKQDVEISGMMPIITAASDDMDNSVMITSVRNFQSRNRRGAVMRMNSEAVNFVCKQPVVDYIEEDQEVSMASPTSVWHLDRIDQLDLPLDQQFSSPSDGSGVDIYIFDTGINYNHSEFEGRAEVARYDPTDETSRTNLKGRDCHGHGTHVAALAGGKTFGVAKAATLHSMRVLGCNGGGSFVSVILGLDHVITQKISQPAQKQRKVIVNMSLRGPYSRAVDDAIKDATKEGILVVVAAGNDFDDACRYSPGASPDAITVGGTQRNDDLYLQLFDGTNYGKCVDIFAPGQNIRSAGFPGSNSISIFSGTSQASPQVSGAAAVYWSINTMASVQEIKDIIISTCTRDRLNIDGDVPPAFRGLSPNCLLHIDPNHTIIKPNDMKTYEVLHSVPSMHLRDNIIQMENKSYALIFINRHQLNSKLYYSLIFKHMPRADFKTLMVAKLSALKATVNDHKFDGYQLTLIHDMDSINYIAVLQRTDIKYTEVYRVTKRRHDSMYRSLSANYTLVSTTLSLRMGSPRYSSVYMQGNETTLHWSSVTTTRFLKIANRRYKRGMYLSHMNTVPTEPAQVSIIFRPMTAPVENYLLAVDVDGDKVQEVIRNHMTTGFVPTVVAGLHTPIGLRFVIAFELLL